MATGTARVSSSAWRGAMRLGSARRAKHIQREPALGPDRRRLPHCTSGTMRPEIGVVPRRILIMKISGAGGLDVALILMYR